MRILYNNELDTAEFDLDKFYKSLNYHHYVCDPLDATKFDKRQANIWLKKFKHPEKWELVEIEVKKNEKR